MRLGRIQNDISEKGFDLVVAQGMEFIEICCNFPKDMDSVISSVDAIKEQIARTGVDVSCVGRWNHDIQVGGVIAEDKLEHYLQLLDAAVEIGAKTFVCGCNYDDSVSLLTNYKNAVYMFSKLIERADGRIKIAIENCEWNNFIVSPEQWKIVLGELPELCIKFDASHAYNRGEDYLAQLSDWCERVAHVHIKGTVHAGARKVDDPPAGMDDILWRPLFAVLYSRGYDGDLSIEPHSKTWQGELGNAGVLYTRDFIRNFII